MAGGSTGQEGQLKKMVTADNYILSAVSECYKTFQNIMISLVQGRREKELIHFVFSEVEEAISAGNLMTQFNLTAVPRLYELLVKLIELLLDNKRENRDVVVILLQDMLELVTRDITDYSLLSRFEAMVPLDQQQLFASAFAINFPVSESEAWAEKIKRLYLLLTVKESATDVPSNLEAQRRLSFFSNSLFMYMPHAPKVCKMLSFSVLTSYYNEEVIFSLNDLKRSNEDGVSDLFYLQKTYPDEWINFLERVNRTSEYELEGSYELEEQLCLWASYRSQTLARTVRGMMYYRKALEIQAFLELATDEELTKGYKAFQLHNDQMSRKGSLWLQCQAMTDMKFTYVLSSPQYGIFNRSGDARAQEILKLMTMHVYPSLRVAFIDEVEEPNYDRSKKLADKVYYSTLVKAVIPQSKSSEPVQNLDQVIYRIKLPGPAILGVGKPEHKNNAIVFTRGEGLQTVDMNQDNYLEEALKVRNLLQHFLEKPEGVRHPTILGLREHIISGSVSSLAWFISNLETSSVTIGQRLLANLLKVRFHYGHSDVFDRLFHLTRGGIGKASRTINYGEMYAGYNSILYEGCVTHHEYIQLGKGTGMGHNQISLREAVMAICAGEQTLSRDLFRLGRSFDFFRMLSCYFTTIGVYFSTLITVLMVYVFLYGRLYLVLRLFGKGPSEEAIIKDNKPFQVALAAQCFVQFGFLVTLPMMMEVGLEKDLLTALSEFVLMQLQLAPVFFTFSLGTMAHYYARTLLHGGALPRAIGSRSRVVRTSFSENYRFYSRSHIVKGLELVILLLAYQHFDRSSKGTVVHILSALAIWFMAGTWLFAPFLFNPCGFEWQKIVDDWSDWKKWISNRGGIGIPPQKSWESWWNQESEHLRHTGKLGTITEVVLSLRFFIYHYGLVWQLNMAKNITLWIYGVSWIVIFMMLLLMKMISVVQRRFSGKIQLIFQLTKGLIFLSFVSNWVELSALTDMTAEDITVCILALIPTGWGLLEIAQACKPLVLRVGLWGSVGTLARGYDYVMGCILFTPVAFLSWFPFVSEIHTRLFFNHAFSRGLQISLVFSGQKRE